MPNRLVSLLIVASWAAATVALLRRDVLPELLIGPPPDLRTVAQAEKAYHGLTRWSMQVASDPAGTNMRAVGQVETQTRVESDGWLRMASYAWFDSEALLKGTPLASLEKERIEVRGVSDIDPLGNLDSFRASVRVSELKKEVLVLAGTVRQNSLTVTAQGPLPFLNWRRSFPYQSRQMVQQDLGPLDWMPNLQVGQRWRSQVVSPLSGRVEDVQVVVERKRVITWDSNPVTTLEVVTSMPPLASARTWVRPDGLVLRQELPFAFVRLVLERLPERYVGPAAKGPLR